MFCQVIFHRIWIFAIIVVLICRRIRVINMSLLWFKVIMLWYMKWMRSTSQLISLYVAPQPKWVWHPRSKVLTLYYGLLYGSNAVFKSCMCLTYTWLLFLNTCFSKSYLFTINNISHNARQFLFFSMDSKTVWPVLYVNYLLVELSVKLWTWGC